jgi:hypothetical protein
MLINAFNKSKTVGLIGLLITLMTGPTHAATPLIRLSAAKLIEVYLPGELDPRSSSGVEIYKKTLTDPSGANMMYITVVGAGIGHGQIALNCRVDGVPSGWITALQNGLPAFKIPNDTPTMASLSYQWCIPLNATEGGSHLVILNAAAQFGIYAFGDPRSRDEWLQNVTVFVDVNNVEAGANACRTLPNPNPGPPPPSF